MARDSFWNTPAMGAHDKRLLWNPSTMEKHDKRFIEMPASGINVGDMVAERTLISNVHSCLAKERCVCLNTCDQAISQIEWQRTWTLLESVMGKERIKSSDRIYQHKLSQNIYIHTVHDAPCHSCACKNEVTPNDYLIFKPNQNWSKDWIAHDFSGLAPACHVAPAEH